MVIVDEVRRNLAKCLRRTDAKRVIVDELADIRTTVLDLTETTRTVHGEEVRGWECRECGQSCEEMYGGYEYCPHCGRKVVQPVRGNGRWNHRAGSVLERKDAGHVVEGMGQR